MIRTVLPRGHGTPALSVPLALLLTASAAALPVIAAVPPATKGDAAESATLLVRVERRTDDDLKTLRGAGLPVVMEMSRCLLVRGGAGDLDSLKERGYETTVLDGSAEGLQYLVVGLRPDSKREAVAALGTILLEEENWALLRVPQNASLETLADARVFVTRVPAAPIEAPREGPSLAPRPNASAETLADPLVQQIAGSVSGTEIASFWSDLAQNSPTGTRYSLSQGCRDATNYCLNKYSLWGIPAQTQNWSTSHAPNVIATHEGAITPGNVFIVIGHLDDLPSSGLAPGADDNASGSVNILESARVLGCYAFRNTIKFINCTGEEQGLLGSNAYAADALSRGENILGVINMDMIGWAGNASPNPENLDLNYNAASQDLGLRFAQAATTYNTGLVVDAFSCPSLSASDHYPFWQRGWKAVCGITDNEGYCGHSGNYPYYHQSSDTIANNGNPSFFYSVVRTSVATLAELAEPFKLAFDRTSYPCGGGTIQIWLGDRDLNTNPAIVETVTISLTSDTETTPEPVVLTERSANSMIFAGSIATTDLPPTTGDGLLSVSPDDTISGAYTDALDCNGATNVAYTASAATDCTAPSLTDVRATNVTGNSALITWTTSEPSGSVVHYGTTPPGSSTAANPALVTAHGVNLTGLSECSDYVFWVESTDAAGNTASNDNAGAYYAFETGKNVNPTYSYAGPPVSIPDNNTAGASVSVSVPDINAIVDVNVRVNINHSYDGDITLSLIGPDGTTVALSNKRGGSGDNYTNTVFDDQAATPISTGSAPFTGSFRPDGLLSAFNGKNPAGTWTLRVVDNASTDVGTIVGFDLLLSYPPQACGPSLTYVSSVKTDACNGSGSGGGNGIIDPGETVTLVVTARNDGTAPVTGIAAALTTSTPGITVLDGSAAFPDLAPGASAPSQPDHLAIQLDPAFPCGSTIDLTIRFTSNEGAWSDDFSAPTGSPGQSVQTLVSTDVPKPIADVATTTSTLAVAGAGTVVDVNATVSLTHTWDGDLLLTLVGPNAGRVTLSNHRGSSGDNYTNTTFDDEGTTPIASGTPPYTGTFSPDGLLSALDGIPANGSWALEIQDTASGDSGNLLSWSLTLTATSAPSCLACAPALAGEVPDLQWPGPGKDALTWRAAPNATSYTVYRGEPSDLPNLMNAATDSCTRLSTAALGTGSVLTENPAPGSIHWYLVRASNAFGEGPAGNATAGPRLQEPWGPCP